MVYFFEDFESLPPGSEPLCIEFINTVGGRLGPQPKDAFQSAGQLVSWLARRSLLTAGATATEADLRRALKFRDALYRVFSAVARDKEAAERDLATLNKELHSALCSLQLSPSLHWQVTPSNSVEGALNHIALSAASLAISPMRERLHECEHSTCGWLFVDRSKNRTRRWCSMSDCGNYEKVKRFRAKVK